MTTGEQQLQALEVNEPLLRPSLDRDVAAAKAELLATAPLEDQIRGS
jgi:hypothetical protein